MTAPKLDQINVRILEELQRNARITNQELAEKVALSPSACLARVKKLEADGILPRFMADIALEKVERILESFIEVTLENHTRSESARFLKAVDDHPHMVSCHRVSGHFDYLIHVVARDMPQLREIADYLLSGGLGVAKIATIPILEEIKPFVGYPLKDLLRDPEGASSSE
jgi:Lrp/AsnC family transcriptional regulator, leucine-responsive regulatory protein